MRSRRETHVPGNLSSHVADIPSSVSSWAYTSYSPSWRQHLTEELPNTYDHRVNGSLFAGTRIHTSQTITRLGINVRNLSNASIYYKLTGTTRKVCTSDGQVTCERSGARLVAGSAGGCRCLFPSRAKPYIFFLSYTLHGPANAAPQTGGHCNRWTAEKIQNVKIPKIHLPAVGIESLARSSIIFKLSTTSLPWRKLLHHQAESTISLCDI